MLLCAGSFAQDTGVIKFLVDVDNGYFEIELNDSLLLKRYRDTLPVGNYNAKIWSPGYVVKPISFEIKKNEVTDLYVEMAKNNDYLQYETDYKAYRTQFHKNYTAPISLTLLSSLSTGLFMVKSFSYRKLITEDIDLYYKSPTTNELDAIKLRVNSNNQKYNRMRTAFYINGGVTMGLIGATIWSIRHFNENYTEPVYNKDSPFASKYSLNFTTNGCGLFFHI